MYWFFALLLFFIFLILTAAGETGKGKNAPRFFFLANLGLAGGGLLFLLTGVLMVRKNIFHSGLDAEFSEWAWDMMKVYYQLSMIPLAVFLVIGCLAFLPALADPKQRTGFPLKLRLSVTVVFSAVLLLIAPMYAFMTVNEQVVLDVYILLTGIGEALLLRVPLLIEYYRRMWEQTDTSVTGK